MARAVLLTGGNEGDVAATLDAARAMIERRAGAVVAMSSLRRSTPWGDMDAAAGDFLNQALIVETSLAPEVLLDVTQGIERELGREREWAEVVNGADNGRQSSAGCVDGEHGTCDVAVAENGGRCTGCGAEHAPRRSYASRPIDIDILFYDDMVIRTERLTVPHPLVAQREFALAPLAEIAPTLRHPLTGLTVVEMLERVIKI